MKVVFVHGALVFDGAWWWHRMVAPLAALELGSRAVELPGCVAPPIPSAEDLGDMRADADAVRAALDEEDEPVVLVGHSYGGMLITDAAAGHGNVRHLVYVTSVIPERGETMADFGAGREPGPWMDPYPEDGTMGLKAELAPDAFMHDCDEETVTGALERLTRQPLAVFGQGARAMAWREKPSTYVVCAEDRAPSPRDATRVCQEGGPRGRATDRTPPHALASRGAGAGDRGGGQAGRVRNRSLGSDHTTSCRAHDSLPGAP